MRGRRVIAIVGAGQEIEQAVLHARELGRLVAENDWVLITGGRNAGVMKAASEGAKEADGLTVGILPDREADVSTAVDVAIVTDIGEARNNIIVLSADVVVACGVDDPGTASEVALALKAGKPVIILGVKPAATDFFSSIGEGRIEIVNTPQEAVEAAKMHLSSDT